jgi:hypothetical protein
MSDSVRNFRNDINKFKVCVAAELVNTNNHIAKRQTTLDPAIVSKAAPVIAALLADTNELLGIVHTALDDFTQKHELNIDDVDDMQSLQKRPRTEIDTNDETDPVVADEGPPQEETPQTPVVTNKRKPEACTDDTDDEAETMDENTWTSVHHTKRVKRSLVDKDTIDGSTYFSASTAAELAGTVPAFSVPLASYSPTSPNYPGSEPYAPAFDTGGDPTPPASYSLPSPNYPGNEPYTPFDTGNEPYTPDYDTGGDPTSIDTADEEEDLVTSAPDLDVPSAPVVADTNDQSGSVPGDSPGASPVTTTEDADEMVPFKTVITCYVENITYYGGFYAGSNIPTVITDDEFAEGTKPTTNRAKLCTYIQIPYDDGLCGLHFDDGSVTTRKANTLYNGFNPIFKRDGFNKVYE